MKNAILVVVVSMFGWAQSIDELRGQLETVLKDTHTPGVSVAIVHRDGPVWTAGIGTADVASGRVATPETLFRIGSTSKAFAALSVLMLVRQGKLTLDDPVRKLAPEVWFENPWEATDPVRVVHLLEHTTGWDDLHLREYAKDAPPGMGLKEAFDYDHHSRTSRWRPGTRMAYCNSGPPVAAYIVEKITGRRFEDFVAEKLFGPIGMKTATYFPPAPGTETTLYHDDGKTPFPYWNIIMRPAGSINASAKDMAAYVQFYLNRGMAGGVQILPAADIDRMENPASTWAAKDGLKAGYGLSNYWSVQDGFVYHGHDGGVNGGLTDMAYMGDVGYFYSINSGNADAFEKVGKTIRSYITRGLQKPPVPPVGVLPQNVAEYAGWYEPASPRVELLHFSERLIGIRHARFDGGKLFITSLDGRNEWVPVAGAQFRSSNNGGDPVATFQLLTPNQEGRFIGSGMATLKQIPGWLAILEIGLTAFVLLSVAAIVAYAPFWVLGGLSRKRRRPAERSVRLWPLLAVLILFATASLMIWDGGDPIQKMGNLTVWSAAFFLGTIAFAVAAIGGGIAVWRTPKHAVRPMVRTFAMAVSAALLIATAYLAYWGIIGVRTWA